MKKWIFLKSAKSLCAVFLAFLMMFGSFSVNILATEDLPEEETTPFATEPLEIPQLLAESEEEEIQTMQNTFFLESTEEIQTIEMEEIPFAEETTTIAPENTVDPDTHTGYRYNLDIQFGSLAFYYDWGAWDTELLAYVADVTSTNPSQETSNATNELWNSHSDIVGDLKEEDRPKAPGWYGFDGVANKISFTNTSLGNNDEGLSIYVRFDYHKTPYGANTFPSLSDTVTMAFYRDEELTQPIEADPSADAVIVEIPYSEPTGEMDEGGNLIYSPHNIYVSMSGVPYSVDDEGNTLGRFDSNASVSIGFLRVTVGLKEEDLIPKQQGNVLNENQEFFVLDPDDWELPTGTKKEDETEETTVEETTTEETISEETEEPIYTMSRNFY